MFISRTMFQSLVDNTESFALELRVGPMKIGVIVKEDRNDFEEKLYVEIGDNKKVYYLDNDAYDNMLNFVKDEVQKFTRRLQHEVEERNDAIAEMQEFI